jgi:hypothetical protein
VREGREGAVVLAAWIAGTGRVAYIFVMLVIAAALAYAVVDPMPWSISSTTKS